MKEGTLAQKLAFMAAQCQQDESTILAQALREGIHALYRDALIEAYLTGNVARKDVLMELGPEMLKEIEYQRDAASGRWTPSSASSRRPSRTRRTQTRTSRRDWRGWKRSSGAGATTSRAARGSDRPIRGSSWPWPASASPRGRRSRRDGCSPREKGCSVSQWPTLSSARSCEGSRNGRGRRERPSAQPLRIPRLFPQVQCISLS